VHALYLFAGWVWAPYTTVSDTLVQHLVPAELRERIFGRSSAMASAAGPLGASIGGTRLGHVTAYVVIGMVAIACLVIGAVALLMPAIRDAGRGVKLL